MCKILNLFELNFVGNCLNLFIFDNCNDENCFWYLILLDLSLCDLIEFIINESFFFFFKFNIVKFGWNFKYRIVFFFLKYRMFY